MNKVGILVFTSQDVLEHKRKDGLKSRYRYCFWETARYPKKFDETLSDNETEKRIYFAVNKQVRGYFVIHDVGVRDNKHTLCFYSDSYHRIENGKILKSSQGWRYYLHENEM